MHICSWCQKVMIDGIIVEILEEEKKKIDSHGICHECSMKYFGEDLQEGRKEECLQNV